MSQSDCTPIVCIVRIFVRKQQKIFKAFSPPFLKADLTSCYIKNDMAICILFSTILLLTLFFSVVCDQSPVTHF